MAGIFDKFINSMKIEDEGEDYDYDYDEELDDEEDEEQKYDEDDEDYDEPAPKKKFFNREKAVDNMERQESQKNARKDENVVPIRTGSRGMEVCMVKATSVEDGREICDILLSGRAVVINLEGMHTEVAQRIIDFASGACYTMNGNLQMISNYIFIATPQTVELSGDFQNLLASDGSSMTNYDLNM